MTKRLAGIPLAIVRGRPVYRMIGAEDAPAGQSATVVDPATGQSASAGTTGTPPADGQSADKAEVVDRAEYDRAIAQLRAADQKRTEAELRAKALEDKDLGELEKTKNQAKELEQNVQNLSGQVNQLRLENAFLRDATFTWHDPSDVLRFIDNDDSVTIDDNGKVLGMEAALKKLAQNKPYLVKTNEAKLPEKGSGDASNSGQKGTNIDEAKLRSKYNALRR